MFVPVTYNPPILILTLVYILSKLVSRLFENFAENYNVIGDGGIVSFVGDWSAKTLTLNMAVMSKAVMSTLKASLMLTSYLCLMCGSTKIVDVYIDDESFNLYGGLYLLWSVSLFSTKYSK